MGTRSSLIMTLAGVHGFYGGLDLLSQLIGDTVVLSRRADGTTTGTFTKGNLMVVLVDAHNLEVISAYAGYLAIEFVDVNNIVIVIAHARPFHHEQGHKSRIVIAYTGVPSHHPLSLPISSTGKTSSCLLQQFNGVPTFYICLRQMGCLKIK